MGNALTQQPSIVRAFNNSCPWEFDDQRSRRINHVLATLDDQPFNVANRRGFLRVLAALEPRYTLPNDKYFRATLIPTTHFYCASICEGGLGMTW